MKLNPEDIEIRFAQEHDLAQIVYIYNQAIRSQSATGDMDEFEVKDRVYWFKQFSQNLFPLYVVLIKSKIVGYCSISPYREGRRAMEKIAEISFYVDYDFHGMGLGSKLLKHALNDASRIAKEHYLAILLDINVSSISLLKKFGFSQWGYFPDIIDFEGKICSHLVYGRHI